MKSFFPVNANDPDDWTSLRPEYLSGSSEGRLYFAINTSETCALWTSDGTAQGTIAVESLLSPTNGPCLVRDVTVVGKQVFFVTDDFVADDGPHGSRLWVSNGTSSGTHLLKNLEPVPWLDRYYYNPTNALLAVGKSLLFVLEQPATSTTPKHDELWRSDGTDAGTVLVKDLGPNYSVLQRLVVGKTLYFVSYDPSHGSELWKSDGTASGTQLVRDLEPGEPSSNPEDFRTDGKNLFFTATVASHKTLWKSDGSASGTVIIHTFDDDPNVVTETTLLTPVGHTLCWTILSMDNHLHLYGVNTNGTGPVQGRLLAILPNGTADQAQSSPYVKAFATAGGKLYFTQQFSTTTDIFKPQQEVQVWVTDGTASGTRLWIGPMSPAYQYVPEMATLGDQVVTSGGSKGNAGTEPWVSDGTVAGTREVRDIEPGPGDSLPRSFTAAGDVMYFIAYDKQHGNSVWVFKPKS